MRYIDGLDVPPRYRQIVEGYRGEALGNFVGSYCGYPVFSRSQKVIHPTTGEVIGYSNDIQIGRKRSVSLMSYDDIFGTVYGADDMTIDELLERGDALLEKERRRRSVPLDMGWTGIKAAAFSGAVGGLLEWFDFSSTTSVTGATAAAAIGGLSSVYRRHQDKKRFRRYMEGFSRKLSKMKKTTFSVNLLAPDSLVYSDAQTGSVDNRQASSVYFIGEVPVDQQQRFDSFWDQADKILGEYGFTEWQGYRTAGMPELIRRILEDVHNDCDLYDNHREKVGSAILGFARRRSDAIKSIEKYQKKLKTTNEARELRQEHRVRLSGLENLDKLATVQIKQIDQECTEAFRELIENIKEIGAEAKKDFMEAKKESIQDLLVSIYGGKSSLQGYFWGELSRALATNSIDPYDESVANPAKFIVDIPGMKLGYNDKIPPKHRVEMLYEAFYGLYSERYFGMLPPEEFIDKLSKDGVWSPLRRYRLGKL